MLPGDFAVVMRAARFIGALFVFALLVVACEQSPTELNRDARLAPPFASMSLVDANDPSICGAGKKTIEISVYLDPASGDPVPAEGVVVTAIKPVLASEEGGTKCWAQTDASGIAVLSGASKDEQYIFIARDEIGRPNTVSAWPYQEFIPPQIPTSLNGYFSAPADATFRTVPMVASDAGEGCVGADFSNAALGDAVAAPCTVGGPGLDVSFVFDQDNSDTSELIHPKFCFETNSPCNPASDYSGALIAALHQVPCDIASTTVPWLVDDCAPGSNVKGVALVQAGGVTDNTGTVGPLGLSVLPNTVDDPTFVEVIAEIEGRTVVGSADICDGCDSEDILAYPAVCYVPATNVSIAGTEYPGQPVEDLDTSPNAALDILRITYGYTFALTQETGGGFTRSFLSPEYDAIAVVVETAKNATGPVGGTVTLKYTPFGVSYTRKIDVAFGVDGAGECFVDGTNATGNGLAGGVIVLDDTCRSVGENGFEFFIEIRNLPFSASEPAAEARVYVSTDGDNLDTARNDLTSAGLPTPPLLFDPSNPDNGSSLTADLECRWDYKNVESKWRGF